MNNTDRITALGPPLPLPALIIGTLLTGVLILLAARRIGNASGAYVAAATWFRYIVSAFQATATTMVGPFSIIALTSLGMFGGGLMLVRPRLLALKFLTPIYVMCAVVIISGAINLDFVGTVNVLVKYGFIVVITLLSFQALMATPDGRFTRLLLFAFAPLILFQAIGIPLGVVKSGENDGSVSYIGGYGHEATFSVMLVTMLVGVALTTKINPLVKFGAVGAAMVGIYLANYRTSMLAILPLLAVLLGLTPASKFAKRDRPFVTAAFMLLACIVFGVAQLALADRFADIGATSTEGVNLFKPPEQYTVAEGRILSGRPVIWSMFITAWWQSGWVQHIIGLGPESWSDHFRVYAHNTLVCSLYEYGPVGVVAMLYLWLSMLAAAFRVRHPQRNVVIGAHISFIVLNMATQPMWMLEGNILYGLLCGYTLFLLHQKQPGRARAVRPPADALPALQQY